MSDAEDKINNLIKESEKNKEIELTEEQKSKLIFAWKNTPENEPPKLKDLVNLLFPNYNLDGRSLEAKAIKKFLAGYNCFPKTNVTPPKIGPYVLSQAEKDYIQNNYDPVSDNKLELCRIMFSDDKISALSREFKAVYSFLVEDNKNTSSPSLEKEKMVKEGDFIPPKNYTETVRLVNKYTHDIINIQEASEKDKTGINVLIRYLHSPRFLQMINTYKDSSTKELFLSEYIRSTYDKPDLTNIELNQILSLCSDYCLSASIQAQIEILNDRLNEVAEDPDGKISMTLAEAISAKTKEYNDCSTRQRALAKELNGSRAARLKNQVEANASVLSLVEYWKDEKNRKKLIQLAELRKKVLRETEEELLSMDGVKAEMFGAVRLS
jgi:hypothetical protein